VEEQMNRQGEGQARRKGKQVNLKITKKKKGRTALGKKTGQVKTRHK